MPRKSEKIPIAGTSNDRRVKLTPAAKNVIKTLREQGFSYRKLAEIFRCSKRSIQNVIKPQKRTEQPKRPTSYWTEKKREYRLRKQRLFEEGKLKPKKKK